ncbi:nascent polypeptide-associated complex protein [Candidatus Woesearchaeota archaeon]|nr:nascent polypeptide-associated complex protein [Candidatus Woesearchaeota archaeon]
MMPGMNPRQMQQMMKRMGINQAELEVTQVIMKLENGKELVFPNPSVSKINMMGQQTYQLTGEVIERESSATPTIAEDDIKTVMEQAKVSRETALQAIKDAEGDLAQAIMDLSSEKE